MCFRQIGLQPQGSVGFAPRFRLPCVGWLIKVKNLRASRRQPGVGQREIWIQRDGFQIQSLRHFIIREQSIRIAFDLIGAQIDDVSVRIRRWLFLDLRLFFPT